MAGNKDHRITRNSSFFRKIPSGIESGEEEESVISQPLRRETRTSHRPGRSDRNARTARSSNAA